MFNKVLNMFLQVGSAGNWEGQEGLTPWCIMSQNAQIYYKNLAAFGARLFKCVWPFWGIMNWRVKSEEHANESL